MAFGIVAFGAEWTGGSFGGGLVALGIMTVFGAAVLFGGRSEGKTRKEALRCRKRRISDAVCAWLATGARKP